MKSLLSGVFWGLLTGGVAVSAVSLNAPQPAGNAPPDAPQVEAPETVAEAPVEVEVATDVEAAQEVTAELASPTGLAPVAQSALPEADTTPHGVPATEEITTSLVLPEDQAAPVIDTTSEDPVFANPQSVAPQIPAGEEQLVISTEPAPIPEDKPEPVAEAEPEIESAPEAIENVAVQAPALAPATIPDEGIAADVATETESLTTPDAPDIASLPEAVEEAPATALAPSLETPIFDDNAPVIAESDPAPFVEDVTDASDEVDVAEANDDVDVTDAVEEDVADAVEEVEEEPVVQDPIAPVIVTEEDQPEENAVEEQLVQAQAQTGGSLLNQRSGSLVDRNPPTETEEAAEEEAEVDPDAPAIVRFAAKFENPEEKPTMSLVLLDDGSLSDAVGALAALPFPVTVALDPTQEGAAETMASYRAVGIEVGVTAKLPAGARPSDVEVNLAAAFAELPESVVVVDPGDGNLQGNREVTAQAMAVLAADGRGLITVPQGFNTGLQAAESAGVPAGLIFRDLDSDGQDARVIQRFMDQAAFRARQEDSVVLLARLRPETLEALINWGDANQSGQVAMAPVSSLLNQE